MTKTYFIMTVCYYTIIISISIGATVFALNDVVATNSSYLITFSVIFAILTSISEMHNSTSIRRDIITNIYQILSQ